MAWLRDSVWTLGLDSDSRLYLSKNGSGRDNFQYIIRRLNDFSDLFSFEAKEIQGGRKMSIAEMEAHPGHSYIVEWQVKQMGFSESQRNIIEEALSSTSTRAGGYLKIEGEQEGKALVIFKYVDYLEGY